MQTTRLPHGPCHRVGRLSTPRVTGRVCILSAKRSPFKVGNELDGQPLAPILFNKPTRRLRSACCARATTGHAATLPPISVMNSRRFNAIPRSRQAPPAAAIGILFVFNVFETMTSKFSHSPKADMQLLHLNQQSCSVVARSPRFRLQRRACDPTVDNSARVPVASVRM